MNESKIILPNLHLLVSLFRKLQDWPLINTSIWPPDITNLLTGSIPLCALMDSILFKGLSALSLEWNSPNLFNCRFIHFAYSIFVWLCWIRCVYLVTSVNTVLSYLCELAASCFSCDTWRGTICHCWGQVAPFPWQHFNISMSWEGDVMTPVRCNGFCLGAQESCPFEQWAETWCDGFCLRPWELFFEPF